jgi:hypothetical protein
VNLPNDFDGKMEAVVGRRTHASFRNVFR